MKKACSILVVALFVLVLSGCGKITIVGKWAQGSFVYTFNDDNTCEYDVAGTKMKCTYKTDGDKLSILYDGNTVPFETTYKIEDKTLIILDSFGSEVKYERK